MDDSAGQCHGRFRGTVRLPPALRQNGRAADDEIARLASALMMGDKTDLTWDSPAWHC
jgi:hypothetical protein